MFAGIAEWSPLPLMIQDAPQTTAVELSAGLLASLVREFERITAVKVEPLNSTSKITALIEELQGADAVVLGGLGGRHYIQELERGASGTMPGPAYAEVLAAAERRYRGNNPSGAHDLLARVGPFANLGGRDMDTFRFSQKHILKRRGIITSTRLRAPHAPVEGRFIDELDELIDAMSLLELINECNAELKRG
jgi:4-hydroxy-tetrahydrodipicolinate synthase